MATYTSAECVYLSTVLLCSDCTNGQMSRAHPATIAAVPPILLVHQPCDGGVGRHVADLARGLTERGYEVVVCGPRPPVLLPSDFPYERCDLGRAINPLRDLAAQAEYRRIVRRLRPQLVHAHSSKAGAIARVGKLTDRHVPVIYTPHGYAFAGHFSRRLERTAYREIERALSLLTARVICVCSAEARLAKTVGAQRKVRVVRNGIAPPPDTAADLQMRELSLRGPVLCALTHLRPGKGLETLIDATPYILESHPQTQLAIWGNGPDLAALSARAKRRGVAEVTHFLGPVSEPLAVLRGADVFVHPSWAEAFPYAILEAMSVGRPIVASDVGGIGEAIVDGESGLLVPAGDSTALAVTLVDLLADPTRQDHLGTSAEIRVRHSFTLKRMFEGVLDVYAEVLS